MKIDVRSPVVHRKFTSLDKVRSRRFFLILIGYWLATLALGCFLALQGGSDDLRWLRNLAHMAIGRLDGVQQAASRSFDPSYVEISVALSLICSSACSLLIVVWPPPGSPLLFRNWPTKTLFVLGAVVMLVAAWSVTELTHDAAYGLKEGRTGAFLWAATSSRLGVVTLLNFYFGFIQLLFFAATWVCLVSPVQKT